MYTSQLIHNKMSKRSFRFDLNQIISNYERAVKNKIQNKITLTLHSQFLSKRRFHFDNMNQIISNYDTK